MKRPHNKKHRCVLRILLFGFIGVVMTVAVAWACARWSHYSSHLGEQMHPVSEVEWPRHMRDLWPPPKEATEELGIGVLGIAVGVSIKEVYSERGVIERRGRFEYRAYPPGTLNLTVYDFGFPVRSMRYVTHGCVSPVPPERYDQLGRAAEAAGFRSGFRLSKVPGVRVLPLWPIPAGFALDTLIFGTGAWVLVATPRRLRRGIRRRRGKCPACGYPVGVSDDCTECGEPVGHIRAAFGVRDRGMKDGNSDGARSEQSNEVS